MPMPETALKTPAKAPKYALHESFLSMQGEGIHAGKVAFFIRLYGCDQHCHFCDSAGTWHKAYKPAHVPLLSATETANLVEAPKGAFVVITGGEPCLYNLTPLIEALRERGRRVHLETAGHRAIPALVDCVTLSPKLFAKPPLLSSWSRAHEIKLIVESPQQLQRDLAVIESKPRQVFAPIWLHPEWSQRHNPAVLRAIVETVKQNTRTRAGYQLHKLFAADFYDPNACQDIIPLGGRVKVEGTDV